MLTENDIVRITRSIVDSYAPLAVGIFGSYAVGTARDQSDLDIFIIKETSESPKARMRAVRRVLFGVLHPLDIHVFTPQEFEDTVYEELSFAWVIVRQARLYYWAKDATNLALSLALSNFRKTDNRKLATDRGG